MSSTLRILGVFARALFFCTSISTALIAQVAGGGGPNDADQISFLNGDRLSGSLMEVSVESIRFKTAAFGEVTIKWEAVREIRSKSGWIVMNAENRFDESSFQRFGEAIVTKPAAAPVVSLDGAAPVSLDPSSTAKFGDQKPTSQALAYCLGPYPEDPFNRQKTSWFLAVNAPESMINGTNSQQQFGGAASLNICERTKVNHSVLSVGGQHMRTWKIHQPSIITDTFDGALEQQHMFKRPDGAGVYGIAEMFFNTSLGMALEKSFGVGLFSAQFTKGRFSYSARADVRYFNQRRYNVKSTQDLAGARLDGQGRYKLGKFSVNGHVWIEPMFNNAQALQGFGRLAPGVSLGPWVCLSLTEEDDYLGNSPPGKRKNYLSSSLTLKIQHGQDPCSP